MPNASGIIKSLRIQNKMTQQKLADLLNVKKTSIQKYESGAVVNLKIEVVERLANIFSVTPAYILGWEYYDKKYNLKDEVQLIEEIHQRFDYVGVELFKILDNVNDEGKRRLLFYAEDLESNNKYSKN